VLSGTFEHAEHLADVGRGREAIEDARQDALIRQQGREAAEADER
jgi:RIO kinase 1